MDNRDPRNEVRLGAGCSILLLALAAWGLLAVALWPFIGWVS